VGAGNGYWAYEIQQNGGNIRPIDIENPTDPWVPITVTNYTTLAPETVTNLFLCWPPANNNMAKNCLTHTKPTNIYFIGIPNSTITGNQKFHDALQNNYTKTYEIKLPSWANNTTVLQKYTTE
jgi:hypothetical protein